MSYQKIEKILKSEPTFAAQLTVRDTEIPGRAGQKLTVPALVYRVGEALKSQGFDLSSVSKNIVLAIASTNIPASAPIPVPATVQAEPETKKPVAKPPPPKPVIVKGAKPSAKPSPKPAEPSPVLDSTVIHRYQCAIASAQLLAALSQLMEKDDWPGCAERRKMLNDLIDSVEKASTQHVNLSVKQIIRAQASQKASNGED